MSEEEKKAIECFKEDLTKEKKEMEYYSEYKKQVIKRNEKLLNLIEKQQKEIEELKQNRDEYKEEYIKLLNARYYNYISKDKIMAKIEELEKKAKEMKYDYDVSYAEEDLFNKNVKFFKEQMQELLEEPKLLEENK